MENILLHKIAGVEMAAESFLGSDCTGSDGDANRVLTTSISSAIGEIIVAADGSFLRETDQYTISGDNITFLFKIWDTHKIEVRHIK